MSDLTHKTRNEIKDIPAPTSITHQHMLACVNTLIQRAGTSRSLRILDVGCGDGQLIAYLSAALPILLPGHTVEMHGLDVADSNVQETGFFAETRSMLSSKYPDIDWMGRLSLVNSSEPWPYGDNYFDLIISNQVMEHVADHAVAFSQINRTLKTDGFSVNIFPLIHYIYEGHIHIPLAHRIKQHGLLQKYISLMSKIGFGTYKHHRRHLGKALSQYSEEHADYLTFMTNYLSKSQILAVSKKFGFRADFRYTAGFYLTKLRSMLRGQRIYAYSDPRPIVDALTLVLLKRISSVTLVLQKSQSYAR